MAWITAVPSSSVTTPTSNGSALVDQFGVVNPLIGLVVAFVSALAAVKWMVAWLQEKGFEIFGWYRIAIGIAAFAALGTGAL